MRAYLKQGGIICTDGIVENYDVVWDLSDQQKELIAAGGWGEYKDGQLVIIPSRAITQQSNIITKRQFLKKVNAEELAVIKATAVSVPAVDYFWQMYLVSEEIDLTDPDTITAITMMEQAGLLATGRASEILS